MNKRRRYKAKRARRRAELERLHWHIPAWRWASPQEMDQLLTDEAKIVLSILRPFHQMARILDGEKFQNH